MIGIQTVSKLPVNLRRPVITLLACTLVACNSGQRNTMQHNQTNQQHAQGVVNIKRAILNLDTIAVKALATRIDVNTPLPDQSSVLDWAIETQTPELVNTLIAAGAIVNPQHGNRFTPMIQACRYGNSAIIRTLLDHGANVTQAIEDGTQAVHLCSASTASSTLNTLIDNGADIRSLNQLGQTPLMFAASAGNTQNINLLVNAGVDINKQTKQGFTALFFAVKNHHVETAKVLIERGADLMTTSDNGTTLTQLAVYSGNSEFLLWYLQSITTLLPSSKIEQVLTDFDRDGYQLLHQAVKTNHPELVATLLSLGADPDKVSQPSSLSWRFEANFKTQQYVPPQLTPIEIAQQQQNTEILTRLSSYHRGD